MHWFVFSLRLEEKVGSEEIFSNIAFVKSQCTTGQPWPRSRSRYVQLPGWLGERGGLILFHFVQWNISVTWHGMAWHEKLRRFFFEIAPKLWKQHSHRRIVLGAVASSSARLRLSRGPHFKFYYCRFNTILELESFSQCNDRHQLYCQFNIFLELEKFLQK